MFATDLNFFNDTEKRKYCPGELVLSVYTFNCTAILLARFGKYQLCRSFTTADGGPRENSKSIALEESRKQLANFYTHLIDSVEQLARKKL